MSGFHLNVAGESKETCTIVTMAKNGVVLQVRSQIQSVNYSTVLTFHTLPDALDCSANYFLQILIARNYKNKRNLNGHRDLGISQRAKKLRFAS